MFCIKLYDCSVNCAQEEPVGKLVWKGVVLLSSVDPHSGLQQWNRIDGRERLLAELLRVVILLLFFFI